MTTTTATKTDNLTLALELAALGWSVFPCKETPKVGGKYPGELDKSPYTQHGKDDSTINPNAIRAWWKRWPNALIGVYCEKSGFFALDLDKKESDGVRSLTELVEKHGAGQDIPAGPIQWTPSGGLHILFELPQDVKIPNNAGVLAPGIDLRSNGYICTGGPYIWQPEHGPGAILTKAPEWLLELIRNLKRQNERQPQPMATTTGGDPGVYWLDYYLAKAAPGNRNDTGFRLALQLYYSRIPKSEAAAIMARYAARVPGQGYTELEAKASLESAYNTELKEPAHIPGIAYSSNGHHSQQPPQSPQEWPQAPEPPEIPENWTDTPNTDPWQAFTLADAYQVRPPVEYIASGLLALPSLNIVYGAPGTLKSMLMAELAICAASGDDWLPPAPWIKSNEARAIKTIKYPVMWLDFDNGRRRTHERIAALARARNLPIDAPITYYSMPSPWLDGSNKNSIGLLIQRIQAAGARLVVIDNLGVVSGDAEENSAEMAKVMSLYRQLAEDTGAAIVLIHHQRKSNGTTGRAGDSLRGHSSIEAALDLALLVEREELADTVSIKATKARGADVLPFSAAFTFEDDISTGELATAKFFGIATEDTQSNPAIKREIRVALHGAKLNQSALVKAVREILKGVGVNRVRDIIDRMTKNGELIVEPGERTEKVYRLP